MQRGLVATLVLLLIATLTGLLACSHQVEETEETEVIITDPTDDKVEPREVTVSATEEYVRLIGRTCNVDDVTWLPQSGSAVEFETTGTRLVIEIVGDSTLWNEKDYCPRYAVLVDNEVVLDDTMDEPVRTVEVFNGESSRSAVVEVMHLSEASEGAVGIRSITVDSDMPSPVAPTAPKDLSIEFIGDSITCAYGVEASSYEEPFKTTTENFMKSYAYLTAKALDADYSTVCYSGYGIISGWSGDGYRNEDMLVPPQYDYVANGFGQQWDFTAHDNDVVVINLGTNDFSYTWVDEERMQEFALGYADFLAQVRERNPDSYIICTLGTMGCQELYPYLEQAVEAFREETGDARVMCYLSDSIDYESDGAGTGGHPNAITQQKSADRLVEIIREVLSL